MGKLMRLADTILVPRIIFVVPLFEPCFPGVDYFNQKTHKVSKLFPVGHVVLFKRDVHVFFSFDISDNFVRLN